MRSKAHGLDRVLALALEPWALTRPMVTVVAQVLARRMTRDVLAFDDEPFDRREPAARQLQNGVAVIPVHGVLAPRMNALTDISGGASYDQLTAQLVEAIGDPNVRSIVLDVDSPGGSVLGASEFARQVLAGRTKKPIVAHANFSMCSSAYWIGSCATEVVAAPSANVGSIGVFTVHEDLSAYLAELGVKVTYIGEGKYKTDGNETEPLTDSAHARLKGQCAAHYGRFCGDVAKGRGVSENAVRNGFGEGAAVNADDALAAGMIDRIATIDETVARLLTSGPSPAPARPALAAASDPPPRDTPQEPSPATGQDRVRVRREAQRALLELGF